MGQLLKVRFCFFLAELIPFWKDFLIRGSKHEIMKVGSLCKSVGVYI